VFMLSLIRLQLSPLSVHNVNGWRGAPGSRKRILRLYSIATCRGDYRRGVQWMFNLLTTYRS
jgi:hypothetical protein